MSLIHVLAAERAKRQYAIYLPPEQITAIIKQWYPNTTFSENKIKVRRSFWYTRDFTILYGPMPTVLQSSWAMSKGMWVIFISFLIFGVVIGLAFGTIHWISNISFTEEIVHKLYTISTYSPPYGQPSSKTST